MSTVKMRESVKIVTSLFRKDQLPTESMELTIFLCGNKPGPHGFLRYWAIWIDEANEMRGLFAYGNLQNWIDKMEEMGYNVTKHEAPEEQAA